MNGTNPPCELYFIHATINLCLSFWPVASRSGIYKSDFFQHTGWLSALNGPNHQLPYWPWWVLNPLSVQGWIILVTAFGHHLGASFIANVLCFAPILWLCMSMVTLAFTFLYSLWVFCPFEESNLMLELKELLFLGQQQWVILFCWVLS